MTILNVHLEQRRALVASNTQGVRPNGTEGFASKILAIPHASTVIAGRGQVAIWFNVFAECYAAMTHIDNLAAGLSPTVELKVAMFLEETKRHGVRVSPAMTLLMVGWSASRATMVGHQCDVSEAGEVTQKEFGWHLAPWEQRWGATPDPRTSVEMVEAARKQALHAKREHPEGAWQGDLTLCEVTPESITFTAVKDFWKD